MKILLFVIPLIAISCKTATNDATRKNENTKRYRHIDKLNISKMELLVADTSIIDPVKKEPPPLVRIGDGFGFVDSTGKPVFEPTQKIIFNPYATDSLVDIFNIYLHIPQDTTISTNCSILYRHVFILYDTTGKINEQINLCLDCTKLDYLKRGAIIQFLDNNEVLFSRLIKNLKSSGAYIPSHVKQSPVIH